MHENIMTYHYFTLMYVLQPLPGIVSSIASLYWIKMHIFNIT